MTDDPTDNSAADDSADESKPGAGNASTSFPPADFSIVVGMFSTQAMVALGTIPNPATGQPDVQLELARHLIDLIAVLENKTHGNLDQAEADMLESTLHHLRMSFLEQSRAAKS